MEEGTELGMKITRASRVARRIFYDVIIPLSVVFVLVAIGIFFMLQSTPLVQGVLINTPTGQQVEVATNHQIFKDVLQTVLAVAALGIAVFGYGVYRILSWRTEEKVRVRIESRYQMSQAHERTSLGLMNWMLYRNSSLNPEVSEAYLDEAIRFTRIAFTVHATELDERDRRVERLICDIRNNWAYYASEKHIVFRPVSSSDQAQFLSFVDWIEERLNKHPENAKEYQDTIDTVRNRFKNSDIDSSNEQI